MNVLSRRRRRAIFGIVIFLIGALAFDRGTHLTQSSVLVEVPDAFSHGTHEVSDERTGDGGEAENHTADHVADGVEGVFESDVDRSYTDSGSSDVPAGFVEEMFSLERYRDVRVGANGSVIGFSTSLVPQSALDEIRLDMEARGWMAMVSSGGITGTFVKSEGRYIWAFVMCVWVGDTTSVVVQCATADEKG